MSAVDIDPAVEAFLARVVAVQVVPANSVLVIHCSDGLTQEQALQIRAVWARVAPDIRVVLMANVEAITVALVDEAA